MKTLIWLPAACLVGLIVGAWGPREELRALKEKVQEEREKPRSAADGFQAFARLANIPDEVRRPHRRKPSSGPLFKAATNAPAAKAPRSVAVPPRTQVAAAVTNLPPHRAERLQPEDLRARIEEAQELWRTRVEMATARWKEKLRLDAQTAERFDAALESMNVQLYETMQTMADLIAQQDRMTPELGLRLAGDVTAVMLETYEQIGACLPPERRAEASEMQMFEFIDPAVAEPLIAVQDKLQGMPPMTRTRGRR